MSKFGLLLALTVLLFPSLGLAQDSETVDLDAYVEALNDSCPIFYDGGWGVNSFTMVGDRYALVDVMLPANLSMILSSFSSNRDNVKRLWIRQFDDYGEQWHRFVDLMVEAGRPVVVNLRPEGSTETALVTFRPSDFEKSKS